MLRCSLAVVLLILLEGAADARPLYFSVFKKMYPELAAQKVNCAICHINGDKKKGNHYSVALAKNLGGKSVKDEKMIMDAIRKIESGECKTGKWGERLNAGEPPCLDRDEVHSESVIDRWLMNPGRLDGKAGIRMPR